VKKTALSGVAASLIGGQTFHNLTGLKVAKNDEEQSYSSSGRVLNPTYEHVYMIIIDEISMLPLGVFGGGFMNMQSLCACQDTLAGLDLVMLGDLYQLLPPGGATAIFQLPKQDGSDAGQQIYGRALWEQVNTVIELTEHNRCKDPDLCIVLSAFRSGIFSSQARKLIESRVVSNGKVALPLSSTCITHLNKDVNDHNYMAPHSLPGKRIYRISADLSIGASTTEAPLDHPLYAHAIAAGEPKDGLISHLDLYVGAKVSILQGNKNLESAGIGNGTTGTFVGVLPYNALDSCIKTTITLPDDAETDVWKPTRTITHILIQIHDSALAIDSNRYDPRTTFRYPGLPSNVYPVARVTKKNTKFKVKVQQFPLRHTHAFTVYKSQGQTLAQVTHAIGFSLNRGYVAASRVCRLKDLFFLTPMTSEDYEHCGVSSTVATVMAYLRTLQIQTLAALNAPNAHSQ
jgi:hypothetical protein